MTERTENRLFVLAFWVLFAFTIYLGLDLLGRGLL